MKVGWEGVIVFIFIERFYVNISWNRGGRGGYFESIAWQEGIWIKFKK